MKRRGKQLKITLKITMSARLVIKLKKTVIAKAAQHQRLWQEKQMVQMLPNEPAITTATTQMLFGPTMGHHQQCRVQERQR